MVVQQSSLLQSKNSILFKVEEKQKHKEFPIVAQRVKNPISIHEDEGSIPGLTQQVKGSFVLPQAAAQVTEAAEIGHFCVCVIGLKKTKRKKKSVYVQTQIILKFKDVIFIGVIMSAVLTRPKYGGKGRIRTIRRLLH